MSYTLLTGDPREVGTGNPPGDMNNANDVLIGMGAVFNVLNTSYSGGADPTGTNFSDAAFQAAISAATGTASQQAGEVLIPPGTYKLAGGLHLTGPVRIRGLGPSNGYNSSSSGASSTLPAVTLNCASTTYLFNMPSQGYLWGGLEMSGLNISFTGTGDVFNLVNFADSAFRDMTVTLTQAGSHVMTCSGANSVLNVIHERCTFVTTATTRTAPMFSITSSIGAGISNNTFFKCKFINAGQDNTQFMAYFACTGSGSAYHVADNFIECWFEHPFGGVYQSLSGSDCKVDGCIAWDIQGGSPAIGNSLYYFGAYSGNSGSQGVRITSCGRNLNGPDGTSTNKWDVECESTTAGVIIEGYFTTPLAGSPPSTYDVYFNFHNCQDVVLIDNQSPQGSAANGNSTTVVTNPAVTEVHVGAGNLSIGGTALGGSGLGNGSGLIALGSPAVVPSGSPTAGLLYGASGQPDYLDTSGKLFNLAKPQGFILPVDTSFLAWNFEPGAISNGTAPVSGTIEAIRVDLRVATPVTNVVLYQSAAGSNLVSNENFASLWTSAGVEVGATADQSGVWNSGVQVFKTMVLTGGPYSLAAGIYWIIALAVTSGGSTPTWGCQHGGFAATSANAGLGANNARWATGGTLQTALPASPITPSSYFTLAQNQFWGGVS